MLIPQIVNQFDRSLIALQDTDDNVRRMIVSQQNIWLNNLRDSFKLHVCDFLLDITNKRTNQAINQ